MEFDFCIDCIALLLYLLFMDRYISFKEPSGLDHEFLGVFFFHFVSEPCVYGLRNIYLGISFKEPTGLDRGHSLFPRFITTIFLLKKKSVKGF